MKRISLVLFATLLALPFAATAAGAQEAVGVGVGPEVAAPPVDYGPPACEWGYYSYYPYACSPYGYYGPQWFYGGMFIGVGPWYGWGRGGYGRGGYGYGRGGYGRGGYGYGARGGYAARGAYGGANRGGYAARGYAGGARGAAPRAGAGAARGGFSGGGARGGGGFSGGGGHAGGGGGHGGGGGGHR